MVERDELSICTVSYNSASFIRLNQQLVRALNPGARTAWTVAENSPLESFERLKENDSGLRVIPGAPNAHIPCHHHTIALRKCTELTASRFVLVIDPDFYVVRSNWVDVLIDHMERNALSIFAVPWHPKSGCKYRYFPAVHFALFDTKKFARSEIDFRPDYPDGDSDPGWPDGWKRDANYFVRSRVAKALASLSFFRARRRFYTDTGSKLYKKYVGQTHVRFELASPVFDRGSAVRKLPLRTQILERILPDELCYFPKHYDESRGNVSFLSDWLGHEVPENWEEFVWQGAPFGFHVRGNLDRTSRSSISELEIVKKAFSHVSCPDSCDYPGLLGVC